MRKLLALAFAVAGLVAMLVGPGPVAASNDQCPNSYSVYYVTQGTYPDKNRNGVVCRKWVNDANGYVYHDDNPH